MGAGASGLIDTDRDFVIKQGIALYIDKDYITACHLLIPQIEHAICNLALKLGTQVKLDRVLDYTKQTMVAYMSEEELERLC